MPAVILILDQIIKALVRWQLLPGESFLSFGSFGITYFKNISGPFSLPIPASLLLALHAIILFMAYLAYCRLPQYRRGTAWIIAGGFSNLVDRFVFGFTTDYFALPFHGYWNLADIAVVVGIIIILRTRSVSPQEPT